MIHEQDLSLLDFATIFEDRWLMIVIIVALLIIYAVSNDFRRFLAIVGLLLALQLMWESINVIDGWFPFGSIVYTSPSNLEFHVMTVPISAVFIKTLVPMVSSYIFTSMATVKLVKSKIDMVKDRGKNLLGHVGSRFLGAGVHVIMLVIIEPVLVAGDQWALGNYETFTDNAIYFGVDPLYFLGSFITTAISFTIVSMLEARIGYDEEEVFFDYEHKVQSPVTYQYVGFIVLTFSAIAFSFIAMFLNVTMGMIDIVFAIPSIFFMFIILSHYSDVRESINVHNFCNDNPDSFLCDP